MKLMLTVAALASVVPITAKEGSPEQQVDALFKQLSSENRGTALQDLFAGTLLSIQKPAEVRAMDAQARGAWEFLGPPESYEILERREIGKSVFRIRWLTKHRDELPLFWSAVFFVRGGKWEALSLVYVDQPEKAGI